MTRQAVSIQSHGSWTFGSPSVLMMFHRTPDSWTGSWRRWTTVCPTITRSPAATAWAPSGSWRARRPWPGTAQRRRAIALKRARAAISGSGQEEYGPVLRLSGDAAAHGRRRGGPGGPAPPPAADAAAQRHVAAYFDSTAAYCPRRCWARRTIFRSCSGSIGWIP